MIYPTHVKNTIHTIIDRTVKVSIIVFFTFNKCLNQMFFLTHIKTIEKN